MNTQLYTEAFTYKNTKLYTKLSDTDMFAIKLSDGTIAYICIMGKANTYNGIGIYLGEQGIQSYLSLYQTVDYQSNETTFTQDCLQLTFNHQYELPETEQKQVESYATKHNISLKGLDAYPRFLRFKPYHLPWSNLTPKEETILLETLHTINTIAQTDLSPILTTTHPTIPLYTLTNNTLTHTPITLPPYSPKQITPPQLPDTLDYQPITNLNHKGILQAGTFLSEEPIQDTPEQQPYFTFITLMTTPQADYIIPQPLIYKEGEDLTQYYQDFINTWSQEDYLPEQIITADTRTYNYLKPITNKLNIQLTQSQAPLTGYQQAITHYNNRFQTTKDNDYNQLIQMVEYMVQLSPQDFNNIPPHIKKQLKNILHYNILPEDLQHKLTSKLLN